MRKVVKNKVEEVSLDKINTSNIYAFAHYYSGSKKTTIFKFHVTSTGYCFVSLSNSQDVCYCEQVAEQSIGNCLYCEDVYEFKTQKEFLEWALKELNK